MYAARLTEQHDGQLGQTIAAISSLLDFNSEERFAERREVVCEQDYHKSFRKGLLGEGLDEHSLTHKMKILRTLQDKVDQYDLKTKPN